MHVHPVRRFGGHAGAITSDEDEHFFHFSRRGTINSCSLITGKTGIKASKKASKKVPFCARTNNSLGMKRTLTRWSSPCLSSGGPRVEDVRPGDRADWFHRHHCPDQKLRAICGQPGGLASHCLHTGTGQAAHLGPQHKQPEREGAGHRHGWQH